MKWDICLHGICLGLKPESLQILPIGFCVSFKVDTRNYNKKLLKSNLLSLKKLIIAMSGPLVNLICIMFCNNLLIIYVNILIFVFNMIPIYPLDGGRILKNILRLLLGKEKALDITYVISNICMFMTVFVTIDIVFWAKNMSYVFIVIYIFVITIRENKKYKLRKKMYKILKNYIAINEN